MKIFFFIVGWCFSLDAFTQNTDSLLSVAKELAFKGMYSESLTLLTELDGLEARQLKARVLAWSLQYQKSIKETESLIADFPEVVSNYQIAATTSMWGREWWSCYQYAETALRFGGDSLKFGILKLKALIGLKDIQKTDLLSQQLLHNYSDNKELKYLHQEIQKLKFQKELIIRHGRDYFTLDSSKWENTSVTLINKTKLGPLLVSAHQAKRFDIQGLQGELEFYPKLDSLYHAYFDIGVSSSNIFPNFRNGISLFRTFKKGFEVELGYRNMHFKEVGNVWFLLGSLIKYLGNNSLLYRLTSIHSPFGSSATHGLKLTHYLDENLSSISVELGSGTNARDFQGYNSLQPFSNINSRRMQLDYKQFLNYRIALSVMTAYEKATYRENLRGERWTVGLGLNVKF